jgi:hypothetical protein
VRLSYYPSGREETYVLVMDNSLVPPITVYFSSGTNTGAVTTRKEVLAE